MRVPFGKQVKTGVVWDSPVQEKLDKAKLRLISEVCALRLPEQSVAFVNWVAGYTCSRPGAVLKMVWVKSFDKQSVRPLTFQPAVLQESTLTFSEAQQQAADVLKQKVHQGFSVSLLDGVTGSGKTEVYFEMLAEVLRTGRQALVLLPEISLTTDWLCRFEKRFGVMPAVWHSGLTEKCRRDTWQGVLSGQIQLVVGARSALFLPFAQLGGIVVDEEHDSSYKQEDGVLYNARDMAVVRAKLADVPVLLASATPSLESYVHAMDGKYTSLVLPSRVSKAVYPDVALIDMRQEKVPSCFISETLSREIEKNLHAKQQTLLFLNRRGYAPLKLCQKCGAKLMCPHCSVALVEHKNKNMVQCHHCGYTQKIPDVCPQCGEKNSFISCGVGIERVAEEVHKKFPTAHVCLVDSQVSARVKDFQKILDQIQSGEIDILIGTQVLAKGHNFLNLTLIGVIDADMSLGGTDLRAAERTYQLLHQVMGRAGRGALKGRAYIQTYQPENTIIQALKNSGRDCFLQEEIAARQVLGLPPFGQMAGLIVRGRDQLKTLKKAQEIVACAPIMDDLEVWGPVPAPLSFLRGSYRFRILVKKKGKGGLQNILNRWIPTVLMPAGVSVKIDIDPYNFL